MINTAKAWLAVTGGAAATAVSLVCLTSPNAVAEPMPMPPPVPGPVTVVTQTVTVAPLASAPATLPQLTGSPLAPAPAVVPAGAPTAPTPAATPAPTPATSGTLTQYFSGKHVTLQPQRSQGFQALSITLPMPPGWTQVPDPNVPDAFAVIANRASPDLYTPNAQVVVYKLVGDFDPREAITHGFIDSQSLTAWQTTDASLSEFYGFPSSRIEGTYRQNDMTLNTSRRHVIATVGPDKYWVSFSVTSLANMQGAPSAADATDAIVNGFRVAAPTTAGAPLKP